MDERPSELVLAAGGLVVRRSRLDAIEVALVHRPSREDWSFPKGKVEPKETLTDCALREVLEETGLACRIVSFVGTTEYRDRKDRPKIVAYWAMHAESGTFRASAEVDELRVGRDGRARGRVAHLRTGPGTAGQPRRAVPLDASPALP